MPPTSVARPIFLWDKVPQQVLYMTRLSFQRGKSFDPSDGYTVGSEYLPLLMLASWTMYQYLEGRRPPFQENPHLFHWPNWPPICCDQRLTFAGPFLRFPRRPTIRGHEGRPRPRPQSKHGCRGRRDMRVLSWRVLVRSPPAVLRIVGMYTHYF